MGCATHAVVQNILSIIAASVLLYFDSLFLNDPYFCFFSSSVCNSTSNYNYTRFNIYTTTGYQLKVAMLKTQIGLASGMLASCVVFILIYIFVAVKTRNASNQPTFLNAPQPGYGMVPPSAHTVVQPAVYNQAVTVVPVVSNSNTSNFHETCTYDQFFSQPIGTVGQNITCPYCKSTFSLTSHGSTIKETSEIRNSGMTQPPIIPINHKPPNPPIPVTVQPARPPIPVTVQPARPSVPKPPPSTIEESWRSKFPNRFALILSAVQLLLIILIFVLEVASLGVLIGLRPTGVGIWCAPFFLPAAILSYLLGKH